MDRQRPPKQPLPDWPALMSAEMAAAYLSMDEASFRKIASAGNVQPVELQVDLERWRRKDLDALLRRLPLRNPEPIRPHVVAPLLDDAALERIVAKMQGKLSAPTRVAYTSCTTGKLVCVNYRERGTCTNRRTPKRADVEARTLEVLREQMLSPAATAAYVRTYQRTAAERLANAAARRAPLEKRLAAVQRRIDRGIDAIFRGVSNASLEQGLAKLEAEKAELEAQLAQEADSSSGVVVPHPRTAEIYASLVAALEVAIALQGGEPAERERRLREAVRGLIDRVVITPHSGARWSDRHHR